MRMMPESEDAGARQGAAIADELLAVRCQLGEPDAFDALIARWHEPLWRYARRVTGDDGGADDTVQEVWVRVLRGIGRLRDRTRLRPWIFGIARRVLMDRLRAKYAEPEGVAIEDTEIAGPDDTSDQDEAISVMHEELALLPLAEREVVVLFYLEELTLSELAQILEIPIGTVKSRLFRARQALRRHLTNKGLQP